MVLMLVVMINLKADRKVSGHEEAKKCRCDVDDGDESESDHGGGDNHSVAMMVMVIMVIIMGPKSESVENHANEREKVDGQCSRLVPMGSAQCCFHQPLCQIIIIIFKANSCDIVTDQ